MFGIGEERIREEPTIKGEVERKKTDEKGETFFYVLPFFNFMAELKQT